jgi:nicotinate-nucleotide adenylyltransferase
LSSFHFDRLIFVPASQSPFKHPDVGASARDRLDMLAASVLGDGRISVDDCELRRKGISYTIDTIEDIELRYAPQGKIGLVIGDDLVAGFPSWKRVDELAERVRLIVARRIDSGAAPFPYPHSRLQNPVINLSSSELRSAIAEGGPWRFLVPQGARRIIEERGLYGYGSHIDISRIDVSRIAAVESYASCFLDGDRFIHSRNVALLAAELCGRFGLDPRLGYTAGIAHDMCKSMPRGALIDLAGTDGAGVSSLEAERPSLLHPRAAVLLLKDCFGIDNPEVLQAVRSHTFGSEKMGSLAKVLYIADKIEPSRKAVSHRLRASAGSLDLDSLFLEVLKGTIDYLSSQGKPIDERTLALAKSLVGDRQS